MWFSTSLDSYCLLFLFSLWLSNFGFFFFESAHTPQVFIFPALMFGRRGELEVEEGENVS